MTEESLTKFLKAAKGASTWREICDLSEIEAFEKAHNVELPCDYRRFLLEFGRGSLDSFLVFSFGREGYPNDAEFSEKNTGNLSEAFPYETSPYHWNRGSNVEAAAQLESAEEEEWESTKGNTFDTVNGAIPISYGGCTEYRYLVLSGPERGRVWEMDGVFSPVPNKLIRNLSFIEWLLIKLNLDSLLKET